MKVNSICAAGAVLAVFAVGATPAMAACAAITNAAQLQAMNGNLAGNYCLANDIDLSSIANFTPIGPSEATPFTGTFSGGNFVIRNLTVTSNPDGFYGLFGMLSNATARNVTLENVAVSSTDATSILGGFAAAIDGASIVTNVHVGGQVAVNDINGQVGGFVGLLQGTSIVQDSSSSADVGATSDGFTGGLVGTLRQNAIVRRSYATGTVFCSNGTCIGGGLVGAAMDPGVSISTSFAAGRVVCNTTCGGLVGSGRGTFSQLFASGTVLAGAGATVGGLFGILDDNATTLKQSFSVGLVGGGATTLGGLIGNTTGTPTTTSSYWDTETSGLGTSAAGAGRTTAQLRADLKPGFNPNTWDITKRFSYPYLTNGPRGLSPQLATSVVDGFVLKFLPVAQLNESNYNGATDHIDLASLAACYTIIARAIGEAVDETRLQDVKIDRYFWDEATRTTSWNGPVKNYATRGTFATIGGATPLRTNVVAALKQNQVVLLRGTYTKNAKSVKTWMLATLFTTNDAGAPVAVVAYDPVTGAQVQIDVSTKMVVSPANFALANFKVDGYQPVTIDINL